MGLKISRWRDIEAGSEAWEGCPGRGWNGDLWMRHVLARAVLLWGDHTLEAHPRDKPLGCLLVDARYDNWFRDFLARRSASPQMQGVRFEVEQDGPFQGEAILLDWKPKPMLILPED